MNPNEMMSVEEALDCVLSHVAPLEVETRFAARCGWARCC